LHDNQTWLFGSRRTKFQIIHIRYKKKHVNIYEVIKRIIQDSTIGKEIYSLNSGGSINNGVHICNTNNEPKCIVSNNDNRIKSKLKNIIKSLFITKYESSNLYKCWNSGQQLQHKYRRK
jgi:hypothetical protein